MTEKCPSPRRESRGGYITRINHKNESPLHSHRGDFFCSYPFLRHRVIFLPQKPGAVVPRSKPGPFRIAVHKYNCDSEPQNSYVVYSYIIFSFSCVLIHRHFSIGTRALRLYFRSGEAQPIPMALRVYISVLFPALTARRHEARISLRHQV